ncbi:MAG: cysteine--tRNA ligase [Thermoguttaceae bacterium]
MLRLYNTLTKTKEEFVPVDPRGLRVGIYLCGPTVYKPSHIGHMVGPVLFDAVKRYLVYCGYDVSLVINVTDVDDKLINEAAARKTTMSQVADEMFADYRANLDALGVLESVTHFPKATEYMQQIIDFTRDLIAKGFAYESAGDVYFDVAKFPEYGKLSHRTLEQMLGEGGDTADRKRSRCDFALWKSAKPGEPSWESPWGNGRPGWHIECSVMSCALLGETFDIHAGGLDLVFPHHENEVAQSEARHSKPMAKYWMHNGLMQASSEVGKVGGRKTRETVAAAADDLASQEANKISKSRGSSAFRDLLATRDPETIRFFLLSSHYRRPIDYSEQRLDEVAQGMESFYRFFTRFEKVAKQSFYEVAFAAKRADFVAPKTCDETILELRSDFLSMMDDDFNTGGAIGVLFDLVRHLNKLIDDEKLETTASPRDRLISGVQVFRELTATLGLFVKPRAEQDKTDGDSLVPSLMELLISLRNQARKNKDFATADQIRNSLTALGVTLEDRAGETTWSVG